MTVASPPVAVEADEVVVKLLVAVATNSLVVAVEAAVDEVVALGHPTHMPL